MEASRKDAMKKGDSQYFTGVPCVHGHVSARRTKSGECLACRAEALVKWRVKNPQAVAKHNKTQYTKTPDKIKQKVREWGNRNPARLAAYTRASQAKRQQRHPKWLTAEERWMMTQAYELAALRTKTFGFPWHVDHIIPLQGEIVSGLHTPYNLRVIPGVDNVRKSNSFEVN